MDPPEVLLFLLTTAMVPTDLPTLLDTQGLPQGMEARQRRLEGVHLLPGDFIPTADSLVRLVNSSTGVCKDGLPRI